MKNTLYKNRFNSLAFVLLGLICSVSFTSCNDDDDNSSGPMNITGVYLEDAESKVPDRYVEFIRLGQTMRLEGNGFTGVKRVYINGLKSYFNPVLLSDKSLVLTVSKNVPTTDADESVRNTIRLVKDGTEIVYSFDIRSAAPTITRVSNCMPQVGEPVIVYGTGLEEVSKVVFPGDVVVTDGIIPLEEGESFLVTMPQGVSPDGGSIYCECANGGAYSSAYFNFRQGLLLNFDGAGEHGSWGSNESMIKPEDLLSEVIGEGNLSQGTYCRLPALRQPSLAAGKNRCAEVWTAGNGVDPDWTTLGVPAETPVGECAIQFEIYVPQPWSGSGFLKICTQNAFNGGEWAGDAYNYVPWIVDGKVEPFSTTGWETVTIPFSEFYRSKASSDAWVTLADIAASRAAGSYCNFGFYFENSDITLDKITGSSSDSNVEFVSAVTDAAVYIDNWRIVPLAKPVYSDFPDDEE